MSKKRVAIVGGGISGLTLAHELEKTSDAEIVLFESSDRLGGKIETDSGNGMVVERGPDCFFTGKPGAKELIEELGIEDELIEPQQKLPSQAASQTCAGQRQHLAHPAQAELV